MKTKKLFWHNPYVEDFTGNIIHSENYKEDDSKYVLILDQTAFYPEGGGQPWDEGKIGDSTVTYVFEEDEIIYHVVDKIPENKDNISCSIQWERRFDFMQQHLGQHILSAVFEKLHNAATVGFHLGKEYVTIDIDKPSLSSIEAKAVETEANAIIYQDLVVKTLFPSQEEIVDLPLRKAPSVTDGIRIVEVDGFDYSPCGGTHPKSTGSVGMIKIRKWEKNKDNTRIEFVCGERCLEDFHWKNQQINGISTMLSVKDIEAEETVTKIYSEYKILNKQVRDLKRELLNYQAKELHYTAEILRDYHVVIKKFEGEDFKDIRTMANTLVQQPNTIALLATKNDKAQVVFSCSKDTPVNMNQLFKEVIPLIDGKGGGNAFSAQGGGDDLSNLDSLLTAAYQKLIHEYLK
ncbi:MAG: alanyl-tRNA editing protein AlaX-L [Clostridiaceae bacterium]|nr:alanyl-tRNA editing protein AlaX-L [Clostridiaceae bacterium]